MNLKNLNVDLNAYQKVDLLELPISDFVGDLNQRWKIIGPFIKKILSEYKTPKVLDLAMGSGQDSIRLLKEGDNLISNEINPVGIEDAKRTASQEGVKLEIREVEWPKIKNSSEYKDNEFDMIFSLGNSFPNYLLKEKERIATMEGIWRILEPQGTLVFDIRNYDYIWNNREEILKDPEHNFQYQYNTTYIGKNVRAFPVEIDENSIHLIHKNLTRKIYSELNLWMGTKDRVLNMIKKIAPQSIIEIYYDYQSEPSEHYDFLQFVVKK